MRYLCIDVETKGQYQSKNDMLCFGACIGNLETGLIEEDFEVYIQHRNGPDEDWEEKCLTEFWNTKDVLPIKDKMMEKIKNEGLPANDALLKFYNWINDGRTTEFLDSLVVITDTAGYDIGFLNHYLSEAGLPSMNYIIGNKYKPTRDSSSFHMGIGVQTPSDGLWGSTNAAIKHLLKLLNIKELEFKPNPYLHDHNPKNDAKSICWEILKIDYLIKKYKKLDANYIK